ncbi:hypothetical protein [Actinoplanes sp. NPDC051494]|uniref:hypothetical protein n=1 Tax=Actinoplanes sp. NPDC051494 TaxID=3363907 RepID=UPI0037BBAD30
MTSAPRTFTPEQTDAGWRSMSLLARFVQRGGHPAPVMPTVALRPGEQQYGAFLADALTYQADGVFTDNGLLWSGSGTGWQSHGRPAVTITSERLLVDGDGYEFRDLVMVRPNPLDWSVNLYFQGHPPLMLRGTWVPWMTVVMCAEVYGSPWPPGHVAGPDAPITVMCENTQ